MRSLKEIAGIIFVLFVFYSSPIYAGSSLSSQDIGIGECWSNPQEECTTDSRDLQKGVLLFKDKRYLEALLEIESFISVHAQTAKGMQSSLKEYVWESKEKIMSYADLNDVALALFIKGDALKNLGRFKEAREAYKKLIDEYYYGQCWCPTGWFAKPAEAAYMRLDDLNR